MSFFTSKTARIAAVGAAASATLFGFSPSASAEGGQNTGYENQMSPEACKSWASTDFKFRIYYNSGQRGAFRNIGYSVWDFADERIGGAPQGGTQPLRFCNNSGAGSLQGIKNNAASANNKHATYVAVVHFNAGYKGANDHIGGPRDLVDTYNENASFSWK